MASKEKLDEQEEGKDFYFPKTNRATQVQKNILFGVSVLFIPVLFLILMYQIKTLKGKQYNTTDSLLSVIARQGIKLDLKTESSANSNETKVEIPPIKVNVNYPKGVLTKKSFAKANFLIEKIEEKLKCQFCSAYNFDATLLEIDGRLNKKKGTLSKLPDYDEILRINDNAIKAFSEERIRFNVKKYDPKKFQVFSANIVKNVLNHIDELNLDTALLKQFEIDTKPKLVSTIDNDVKADSLMLVKINKLILKLQADQAIVEKKLIDTVGLLNGARGLLINLTNKCADFKESVNQDMFTIGMMKADISDSTELTDADMENLRQLLASSTSRLTDLKNEIDRVKNQLNQRIGKMLGIYSCEPGVSNPVGKGR